MAHVLALPKVSTSKDTTQIAAIARDLGLPVQEKRYSAPHSIESDFTPLSQDAGLIWRSFCPTAYRTGITEGQSNILSFSAWTWLTERIRPLADYAHDTVPAEVLRHWADVKNRYAFDAFEIRTTERTPAMHDPLLIGYFGNAMYLLARWGLESPEALPFKEVAKRMKERREQECGVSKFLWSETRHFEDCSVWQAACRVLA